MNAVLLDFEHVVSTCFFMTLTQPNIAVREATCTVVAENFTPEVFLVDLSASENHFKYWIINDSNNKKLETNNTVAAR
jgi:hypothetical protein